MAQDYSEAARLYKLAADQGHKYALTIWVCPTITAAVPRDYSEAARSTSWPQTRTICMRNTIWVSATISAAGTADYHEAARLYTLAAIQGHAEAQYDIGLCYEDGIGAPKITATLSITGVWLRQEHVYACVRLARYYQNQGHCRNRQRGCAAAQSGGRQGNAEAQYELGLCYHKGVGVPIDLKQAQRLYKMAADQGYGWLRKRLRLCHRWCTY